MLKKTAIFLFIILNLSATTLEEPSIFEMMDSSSNQKFINKNENSKTEEQKPQIEKKQNKIKNEDLKNILPTDEPDLNIPENLLYDKITHRDFVFKTANMPKSVIVGEIFSFDVKAVTQSEFSFNFVTELDETNIKWLNKNKLKWVKSSGDDGYTATFFVMAKNADVKILKLNLEIGRNEQVYQKSGFNIFLPKFKELKAPLNYNQIVANNLEVRKFKTTKFDDVSNIMIVEILGKNIDLASFYLNDKTIIKQGVETINGDFSSQSAYYFAVFKPNKTSLDFSYYNLAKEKFDLFSLPVSVEDDEVSTQIGLNPKQSEITIYKNIAIYSLAVLLFVVGIFRKKISYFIAVALLIALGIYSYNPFRKAVLKADVSVKILPTQNSTIFYVSKEKEGVEILANKGEYVKILFDKGKIGWVKDDDILKN